MRGDDGGHRRGRVEDCEGLLRRHEGDSAEGCTRLCWWGECSRLVFLVRRSQSVVDFTPSTPHLPLAALLPS